ncbi:uncharacterized protein LOC134928670 [Pseudophryne corroboree]|uniref:uncharacterized protein LOC134928670 n=1 Tax=Pseudophryne corroboree TaxID=495146 RepID=UPI0030821441
MRCAIFLTLLALGVIVEAESPRNKQIRSAVRFDSSKRRGILQYSPRTAQRGRKKSIWSYNPGHRSLAFLVAGKVEEASPPPIDPESGLEYHCLGCCGAKAPVSGKATTSPELSNTVGQIVFRTEGNGALETEPNAINDRCLGCCQKTVTPSLGVTPRTREGTTSETRRGETLQTMGRQRPQKPQREGIYNSPCVLPRCNPHRRVMSSSSSEEIYVTRHHRQHGRFQPLQHRTGNQCRHLGCRTALGSIPDSSSSSEED